MTTKPFILKWLPNNFAAEDLVKQTCEHLDRRKKALKDDAQNNRIVSSILAQRGGPFIVTMKDVPKKDVEALKGVLECLTGPVLTPVASNEGNMPSETSTEPLTLPSSLSKQ